jgi:hypothetical protein
MMAPSVLAATLIRFPAEHPWVKVEVIEVYWDVILDKVFKGDGLSGASGPRASRPASRRKISAG